jgi:hypothetical protein
MHGVCWMVYCVALSSVDSSSTQECGVYECDAEETQLNVDLLRCCCRESAKITPRSIIHLSMQCQSDAVSLLRHVHTGTRTHAHTTPNRSHSPRTTLLANRSECAVAPPCGSIRHMPRVSDSARRSPLPARWQERLRRAVLPCCNAHGRRCQRRPPASRPLELCNPQRHEAHRSVCVRVFPPVEI